MRRALAPAGIAVLLALAYLPSLAYPYVQDAHWAVETSDVVARGRPGEIFSSHYWKDTPSAAAATLYRPIAVLSFALERRIAGAPAPALSHALNVLLHGAAAWLLCLWLRALGARAGASTAAAWLFAAHPLALYGAVSVVGRADVLALAFGLAALIAFARPRSATGADGAARLGALALFAALCSKEVALAFIPLLLLQELLRHGLPERADGSAAQAATRRAFAGRLLWAAGACLVWFALRTRALGVFPGLQIVPPEDNPLVGVGGVPSWATALAMAGRYAARVVWPVGLSADHSGTAIPLEPSLAAAWPLAGLLLLVAAVAAVALGCRRQRADVGLPAALFLAGYLTVGNLLVLNAAGFAERLFYLPLAGLCGTVAALGARLAHGWGARPTPARAALATTAALALALSWTARIEARMWESDRALMEQAVRNAPHSMRANMALAQGHRGAGRPELAEPYFRAAVEAAPLDSGSRSDLGIFLAQAGRYVEAEESLRRAVELDPENGAAWIWLGATLRRGPAHSPAPPPAASARAAEAERALRKGVLLRPDLDLGQEELADLLARSGRFAEAAARYDLLVRRGRRDLEPRRTAAKRLAAQAPD